MREGSLEAPTRHPLDWKSEAFYGEAKTLKEVGRIFPAQLLETIPGTTLTTIERCYGHDGTWGVKKEYYDDSMKIGRPVFQQANKAHPLTLLRKAYGI